MEKSCLYCGNKFVADKRNHGKQKYCCKNHGHQHWRKLNPEKDREQSRRSNLKKKTDPDKKANYQSWLRKYYDKPERRFAHYVSGAKERGLPFEFSFEQFMEFWQKPCHYCGSEIKTVGIDRIDNSLGYTTENSVSCCETCNNMKRDLSIETFITQCNKIANRNSLRYSPSKTGILSRRNPVA